MLRNQASNFYFQKAISSWRKGFNNENACFIALLSIAAISRRYKKHTAPYRGEKVCLSPKKSLFSIEGSILVFCKSLKTPCASFIFLPQCYSHLLSLFEIRLWILCGCSSSVVQPVLRALHPSAFCVITHSLRRGSAQIRTNTFYLCCSHMNYTKWVSYWKLWTNSGWCSDPVEVSIEATTGCQTAEILFRNSNTSHYLTWHCKHVNLHPRGQTMCE